MKNPYLEVIRGFAALTVFLHHLQLFFPTISTNQLMKFLGAWGHQAVVVFFVLSGVVIGISQSNKPKNAEDFLINRFIRIIPIYWFAIIFSVAVLFLFPSSGFPSMQDIFLSLVFIADKTTISDNQPIWSLTFEMFFYYLFAITLICEHKSSIKVWYVLAFASLIAYIYLPNEYYIINMILEIMSYSIIWLMGYKISLMATKITVKPQEAVFSFLLLLMVSRIDLNEHFSIFNDLGAALVISPLFIYIVSKNNQIDTAPIRLFWPIVITYILLTMLLLNYSNSGLSNKLIYIVIPLVYLAYSFFAKKINISLIKEFFINAGKFLGSISFSLYIIHFPVLYLFSILLTNHIIIAIVLSMIITLLISFFLEKYYQPFIRNKIQNN